jgi:uncharacterized damage-inducible protein DinB
MGEAVDRFLKMMGMAFWESPAHSLIRNLDNVTDAEWDWRPTPEGRSIADIIEHVGAGKYVFINRLFGANDARPGEPPSAHPNHDRAEMMAWMRAGHDELIARLGELSDDEFGRPNPTGLAPFHTAWTGIEHDLYHAGELSHLRAIQQGNDRWGYFPGRNTQ